MCRTILALVNAAGYSRSMNALASYLHNVRKERGLSLKKVEKAAGVSNAYLSQLERGLRNPPHPDILKKLARVYEVPLSELLAAAGYAEDEKGITRNQIEQAFQHVVTDPKYRHGTRLKSAALSLDAKQFIVEMYEKMTGRNLLGDK
jgi:HTH-type transcriptional regulator, competence development regulator